MNTPYRIFHSTDITPLEAYQLQKDIRGVLGDIISEVQKALENEAMAVEDSKRLHMTRMWYVYNGVWIFAALAILYAMENNAEYFSVFFSIALGLFILLNRETSHDIELEEIRKKSAAAACLRNKLDRGSISELVGEIDRLTSDVEMSGGSSALMARVLQAVAQGYNKHFILALIDVLAAIEGIIVVDDLNSEINVLVDKGLNTGNWSEFLEAMASLRLLLPDEVIPSLALMEREIEIVGDQVKLLADQLNLGEA